MKELKVLFDTDNYEVDEFIGFDEIKSDLSAVIEEHVIQPRGKVSQWIMLSYRSSHYGAIANNGLTGYSERRTADLVEAIISIETERFVLIDNDGKLQINFYDHDGVNSVEMKSLSKSKENYYESVVEYESFENKLEFIKKLPTLRVKKQKLTK